jgi:hypothetical protein
MKSFTALWRVALAVGVAAGCLLVSAGSAFAAGGVSLCIPEAENTATVTPTKGACPAKYKLTELGAEGKEGKEGTFAGLTTAEKETLLAVLPYVKFVKEGIAKKPTIQFSGANVQVVSGAAKESEINGLGNLIVGRDEEPGTQSGSNNLVIATFKQSFTSYGGLLAGARNTVSGVDASASGGEHNVASASAASVDGGEYDTASGLSSSVSGGYGNTASNKQAAVSGGQLNKASGLAGTVSGGLYNDASGTTSWVSGGAENVASEDFATVSGGFLNTASGFGASVSGGETNAAHGELSSVSGGEKNTAIGKYSSILGGKALTLATEFGEDY